MNSVKEIPPQHYYGDIVRIFYLIGGLIMLVTLPFFLTRLPITLYGAILLVIVVGLFAGFTNPRQLWTAIFDFAASGVAVCVFEYYAVVTYLAHSAKDWFVWVNEVLAVIFFLGFYYSVKTVRGFFVERKSR